MENRTMDIVSTSNETKDITVVANETVSNGEQGVRFDLAELCRFMWQRFPRLTCVLIAIVVLTVLLQIPFTHDVLYQIPVSIASIPVKVMASLFGIG